jgi:DNA transposition AAA+ family ATPase
MAQVLQFTEGSGARVPEPGAYVETETAQDIARSLTLALRTRGATMIAGRSGVGKTTAVDRFCQGLDPMHDGQALRITVTSGMGSPWWVATELLKPWGKDPQHCGGIEGAFEILCARLDNERKGFVPPERDYVLIVVDEAQYLDHKGRRAQRRGEAFEWLRGLAEAAGVALVFTGDLALVEGVKLFPQLESRMRRPVVVKASTPGDVAAVAQSYGVTGDLELRVLQAVARKAGALRNVAGALELACIFADSGPVRGDHIGAAVADLKLDGKGVL